MGKGNNVTTQTSAPNPLAGQAYASILGQAANVAGTPYTPYGGELVAPVNAQQSTGIANINQNYGYAQPFIQQAAGLATQGATPITAAQIAQYESPYTQQVVQSTENQFANQNAQQQQGVIGNAIAQGALGGNRSAIAQSELANQQQLAQAPVIAGLENQGYQTGLNTALTEQQAAAQGAYSLGNLGVAGQNAALTGANAQVGAGTLQQTTQQAQDAALYQQYINQMAYPFQTTQWLSGIDTGVGSQMGGTSSTTAPAPSMVGQIAGGLTSGVGILGGTGAFGASGWLAPALAALWTGGAVNRADGGVANADPTIPETPQTLIAQRRQLINGHRKAHMYPHGTPELPVPDGHHRVVTKSGVFHFNPHKIDADTIHRASEDGRENEVLDLGPVSKHEVMHRLRGGEIPVAVVERSHDGTEVRAAAGTHTTAHRQRDAMEKTKSPGHTVSIEDPRHVISHRLMHHYNRLSGGRIPGFDTGGGASYQTFGGGYGTPTMPYSGGKGFVPTLGITHGGGAPRPPQDMTQRQPSIADQAKAIGQLASSFNTKKDPNAPQGILPSSEQTAPTPVGVVQPIGMSPEAFSPTDYTGSPGQIYYRGGGVPHGVALTARGYADGGSPEDDFTMSAPSSGVLPMVASPPTQATFAAPRDTAPPPAPTPQPMSIRDKIIAEAQANGVDPGFALRQAGQESGLRQYDDRGNVVTSRAGAVGVGQIMPGTARDLGIDPYDTDQNIHGMVTYDRQMLDKYKDPAIALAAYNAGPGKVDSYLRGERPLPAETQNYVSSVTGQPLPGHRPAAVGVVPSSPDMIENTPAPTGVAPQSNGIDLSGNSKLWPSLMAAGFGMLASRSPFAGVAIGEGAEAGLHQYGAERAQEQEVVLNQQKIAMEARKLDQEARLAQQKLAVETMPYSQMTAAQKAEQAYREGELNKPVPMGQTVDQFGRATTIYGMRRPDGSLVPIDPKTGLPSLPTTPTLPSPPTSSLPGATPTGQRPGTTTAAAPQAQPKPLQFASADDNDPQIRAEVAQYLQASGMSPTQVVNSPGDASPEAFRNILGDHPVNEGALEGLSPGQQAIVKMMVTGRLSPPSSFALAKPFWFQMLQSAAQYDPGFDQATWTSRNAAMKDLTSGVTARNVIRRMNTAANHLNLLDKDQQELNNYQSNSFGPLTGVVNTARTSWLAHSQDPRIVAVNTDANAVSGELGLAFKGYDPGVTGLAEWRKSMDPSMASDESRRANKTIVNLVKGQLDSVVDQARRAGLNIDAYSLLSPAAREVYERLGGEGEAATPVAAVPQAPAAERPALADRFKQLRSSGMSATDAYTKMHQEGYQ